jgi:hypothetical protein
VVIALLAWSAWSFGAVYPWGYWPLIAAQTGIGALWLARLPRPGGETRLWAAAALIAASITLQLIPLHEAWLRAISPAADRLLQRHDLGYAILHRAHALSIDPAATTRALIFFAALAIFFAGLRRALTRFRAERIAAQLAVLGGALAAIGILERFTSAHGRVLWFWTPEAPLFDAFGPFVNRNHFAGWMALTIPLAGGLFFARVGRGLGSPSSTLRSRVLWFASDENSKTAFVAGLLLVMMVSLVLTLSRSGIVATGAAGLLTMWATAHRLAPSRRPLASGNLGVAARRAVAMIGPRELAIRFAGVWQLPGRAGIWADSVRIARDFWPWGSGVNAFGTAALYYQTASPDVAFTAAHNEYLQLATDGGALVGIPVVIAIVVYLREARRHIAGSTGTAYWLRVGAFTGLVAIALQSLLDFSLQIPADATLAAVLAAIATYDDRQRGSPVP